MAEIIQLPESNGNVGMGNIPFSIPIGSNGGFGFGNGMNGIVDLFGLAIIASIFGWNNGGFGGGFGGGNGAAGFISNQLNNDAGRELIMPHKPFATIREPTWQARTEPGRWGI